MRVVEDAKSPRSMAVVTEDAKAAKTVPRRSPRILSSEDFLRRFVNKFEEALKTAKCPNLKRRLKRSFDDLQEDIGAVGDHKALLIECKKSVVKNYDRFLLKPKNAVEIRGNPGCSLVAFAQWCKL